MRERAQGMWVVPVLFIGSGCAALIYEVVWFHLLSLVVGASGVSLAILLGSFMGGMCLGSLWWPRICSQSRHPLKVYAGLEVGIAVLGLVLLLVLPKSGTIYWSLAGYGPSGIAWRGLVAAALLLPPTFLMGATLPAVARWVKVSPVGLSRLGYFYGANTFGAVLGTLAAGFWLLRVYDVNVATFAAMAINLAVAAVAYGLARQDDWTPEATDSESSPTSSAPAGAKLVFLAVAMSGLTALGAEVIWTRLLSLLFGATVYTFSIILAVFLSGLGAGSLGGSALSRRLQRPGLALAICQLLLVFAIPFSAFMIVDVLPHVFAERDPSRSIWLRMTIDLLRASAAMLPAAVLWGASFPLAVAAVGGNRSGRENDAGALVGRVYAANTVGAILGSALFALAVLPGFGTQAAQQLLTVVVAASGTLLLIAELKPTCRQTRSARLPVELGLTGTLVLAASIVLAGFVPAVPTGLLAFGRNVDMWNWPAQYYFQSEGLDAAVVVSHRPDGPVNFHVSGKVVASNSDIDLRIERMLGHLPAMAHGQPKTALVIGCGAGVTAGSLLLHPSIERIVICEIEREVPNAAGQYFSRENYGVIDDARTTVIHDDARHFLASTDETFDVITTDPIHPWVRGAAALYTADFFRVCRKHLNPGGVVAQWVPMYETSEAAVKCEIATLVEAFPDCTIWNSHLSGGGYDVVVLATQSGRPLSAGQMASQATRDHSLWQSLGQVGLRTTADFRRSYVGRGADLGAWLQDAMINRDSNLRLQYLAGLAPDQQVANEVIVAMAGHLRSAREIGTSSPNALQLVDGTKQPTGGAISQAVYHEPDQPVTFSLDDGETQSEPSIPQ